MTFKREKFQYGRGWWRWENKKLRMEGKRQEMMGDNKCEVGAERMIKERKKDRHK